MIATVQPLLGVERLSAGYGKKLVLADVSASLAEGDILLVLGHNGAGKTTLLRSIFGLTLPREGAVRHLGVDVTCWPPAEKVRRGIALVPQGHGLFASLSVADNLELGARAARDGADSGRRDAVLDLFPILRERFRQRAGTMSGGQQQMLAIGIALMQTPRILLLDEPSIGLAPNLVDRVMTAIARVNRELGISIIMVEQDVRRSLEIASRAIVLRTGRKIYDGEVGPLRDHVELMKLF